MDRARQASERRVARDSGSRPRYRPNRPWIPPLTRHGSGKRPRRDLDSADTIKPLEPQAAYEKELVMILDHIGIPVSDVAKSKAFFEKALAPLGIGVMMDFGVAIGFGKGDKPDFWI